MSTAGKIITCTAAVAWEAGKPLSIEQIEVAPPKAHEVRVQITASGVCHTDAYTLSGQDPEGVFGVVLGHEGAGIVESVGDGVTNVEVGDHVLLLYIPECMDCKFCTHPSKTNLCSKIRSTQGAGFLPDGTTRLSCRGKSLYSYMGCSSFSEYTVVAAISVVKVRDDAPLDSVCLLGCGVTTGVGAARKTAKIAKGSSVAVFGVGGVGLSVIQGARMSGASRIIAVDVNDGKFAFAKKLGATECINPKDLPDDKTIQSHIIDITDGGVDFSFECVGKIALMRQALECTHKGWGQSIIIGVAGSGEEISTRPFQLVTGRSWRGSAFGGVKGRSEMGGLVDEYMNGDLEIDSYITKRYPIEDINTAFDDMHSGKNVRGVVLFSKQ
jgi:S-(hydroxymethyl)glutathione dehydrogenase / alcohol dehydrogenase